MRFKNFNFLILIIISSSLSIYLLKTLNYSQYNCRRSRDVVYPQEFLRFINGVGEQSGQMAEMFKIEWSDHIDNSRRLIMQGAQGIARNRVIIMGAGNCMEIPLEELAQSFQSVILQDLDLGKGIGTARDSLSLDLQSKVALNPEDVSSVGALFLNGALEIINSAVSEEGAVRGIIDYMNNIELFEWDISIDEKADYIVCSLLLSVLMLGEFVYLERKIEDIFGDVESALALGDNWARAKIDFKSRVIDNVIDKIAASLNPGGKVFLADSVIQHASGLGGVIDTVERYKFFSAEHLRDLLKGRFNVDYEESWDWPYLPEGNSFNRLSEYEIETLILSLP